MCPVGFCMVHINGLHICCNTLKYVDDRSSWEVCAHNCHDSKIQQAVKEAAEWSSNNIMKISSEKTEETTITFPKKHPTPQPVIIDGAKIERTATFRLLGVMLSSDLSWEVHVRYLYGKRAPSFFLLTLLKRAGVPLADLHFTDPVIV